MKRNEYPASVLMPGEGERLIRKKEVARRLGLDVRTIDNYMRRGWIPYYKVGRLVFFCWPEVVEAVVVRGRGKV